MKIFNEPIPANKIGQFDEILKACGGRYLSNPRAAPDKYGYWRVDYSYEDSLDYQDHKERWNRVNLNIIEKIRQRWWKRWKKLFNIR